MINTQVMCNEKHENNLYDKLQVKLQVKITSLCI